MPSSSCSGNHIEDLEDDDRSEQSVRVHYRDLNGDPAKNKTIASKDFWFGEQQLNLARVPMGGKFKDPAEV